MNERFDLPAPPVLRIPVPHLLKESDEGPGVAFDFAGNENSESSATTSRESSDSDLTNNAKLDGRCVFKIAVLT
jgi:hypothetical protein